MFGGCLNWLKSGGFFRSYVSADQAIVLRRFNFSDLPEFWVLARAYEGPWAFGAFRVEIFA